MYAGVDEAGRGPVLGPLVVAGVAGRPEAVPEGVGDSKTLAPQRREQLAERIRETSLEVAVEQVTAEVLNDRMEQGVSLDEIEAEAFARVLDELAPPSAVTDTVGSDPEDFATRLEATIATDCEVTARAGADASDPMVSAASIVAKVRRDAALQRIGDELDAEIGSGYPSDARTRAFLEDWRERSVHPPPYARTAWSTLDDLGFGQRRLTETKDAAGSQSPPGGRGP